MPTTWSGITIYHLYNCTYVDILSYTISQATSVGVPSLWQMPIQFLVNSSYMYLPMTLIQARKTSHPPDHEKPENNSQGKLESNTYDQFSYRVLFQYTLKIENESFLQDKKNPQSISANVVNFYDSFD